MKDRQRLNVLNFKNTLAKQKDKDTYPTRKKVSKR